MKPSVMLIDHLFGVNESECNKVFNETEPKYAVGERVEVSSWTRTTVQEVVEIRVTYHHRSECYCWGYRFADETGLAMTYVPEGYLRKLDKS